jgi:hypothetical protein
MGVREVAAIIGRETQVVGDAERDLHLLQE